jgi:uncharacterized OsmC-like protein
MFPEMAQRIPLLTIEQGGKCMSTENPEAASPLAGAVAQVRAHLRSLPEGKAKVTFRTATRLVEGLTTEASIRTFKMTIDEPVELGGANLGPNPVEVVLAAFGTCQEIVYAVYAAAMGIRLDKVEVDVEGDLDPRGFFGVAPVSPGFAGVRFNVRVDSPEPAERIAELVRSVNEHCPVLDILKQPVAMAGAVELNGKRLDAGA